MLLVALLTILWITPPAFAQTDRIYKTDGKVVSGKTERIVRQGVSIKVGGKTQNIPTAQIRKMLFQGEPPGLVKGREFALDGQLEQAKTELDTIKSSDLPREAIRTEAEFYQLLVQAKLALSGRADRQAAAKRARAFLQKHNESSWHAFDAIEMLGDLALALDQYDQAKKYYGLLGKAASKETQLKAKFLTGVAELAGADVQAAREDLQRVLDVDVASTEGARLKILAKAKLAEALAAAGDAEAAKQMARDATRGIDTLDVDLVSRVFNSLGAVHETLGDNEGALLAYLRTHLLYASVPETHARALSRLAELWKKVGKPGRAAQTQQELRERYPGYDS